MGDYLLRVDGITVETWRLKELAGLLLGPSGSEVKLAMKHPSGQEYEVPTLVATFGAFLDFSGSCMRVSYIVCTASFS
jgi:hypothetical protein